MNNEFDFKGYLKNNPLLLENTNNDYINETQSKLRERIKAEILSALKESTILMRDPSIKAKVDKVINILKDIEVDGETMEFILKQVGMEDQMQHQLTSREEEAEKKQMFKNVNKGLGLNEAEEEDTTEEDTTAPEVADVEPKLTGNEKEIQDALTKAYEAAKKVNDKKLVDQIGNTITFFTRTHLVKK